MTVEEIERAVSELYTKYPSGHPEFTIEEWRGNSLLQKDSYWVWVISCIRVEEEVFRYDFAWE